MKKLLLTALLPVALWSGIASSALTLNADRVVYNEADGDASVTVHSDEDRVYLIQTWLDSGNSTAKQNLPFVVTPPLFRLAPRAITLFVSCISVMAYQRTKKRYCGWMLKACRGLTMKNRKCRIVWCWPLTTVLNSSSARQD